MMVRNLETFPTSRGARARFRIVREAEGQVETRATELTEKIHDPNRKPVEAKNLAQAVEKFESELREYEALTRKTPDEHTKTLALKRMLPLPIRHMLQTVGLTGYHESKEYSLKNAREFRNERAGGDSQAVKTSAGKVNLDGIDHLDDGEPQEPLDEQEALALQKGKGKGFKGECYNCGKTGHRAADCFAKGGGKEGGQKGQKGGYGKGPVAGILQGFGGALFGQPQGQGPGKGGGYKGKGKSWGNPKGKGAYGKGSAGP